ncbi:hypothetical protein RRF57_012309 [Xylaria bambusicola]|uniref:Uncharacterized protein n=1 Tax=Xylaria bambusicola TaxID=326684 RepID=A0AAN7UUZ7_9PEZI
MSHDEASPLLSSAKKVKGTDLGPQESAESTPLLSSSSATVGYDGDSAEPEDDNASIRSRQSHPPSDHSTKKKLRRWPSFVAMGILGCFVIAIIVLAFIVPDAVQEYAQQAAVIEPTSLSIDSITTDGIRARIQANFQLDGSRVKNDNVRRIGKASTWVANQLGSDAAKIDVYVPDYDNILLGSATIPPLVVSLRDGVTTQFDFIADIHPGNVEGMRTIANDWLDGRLDKLRLNGKTDLNLKSGFVPLGTHTVSETLIFEGQSLYRSFSALYFGEKVFF